MVSEVNSRTVRDLMQSTVITVAPDVNLPSLQRKFSDARVGALPVVDRDRKIVGIVSRTDVMRRFSLEQSLAELADSDFDQSLGIEDDDDSLSTIAGAVGVRLAQISAADVMSSNVISIGPDEPAKAAAATMVERKIHRLPVVEEGLLVGIVSAFDFMRAVAEA